MYVQYIFSYPNNLNLDVKLHNPGIRVGHLCFTVYTPPGNSNVYISLFGFKKLQKIGKLCLDKKTFYNLVTIFVLTTNH